MAKISAELIKENKVWFDFMDFLDRVGETITNFFKRLFKKTSCKKSK